MPPAADDTRREESRLAGLLAALIFLGSLLLVGIPIAWLWLLSHIGQPYLTIYFLSLIGCPSAMIAWSAALIRLNRVYVRLNANRADSGILDASIVFAVVVGILIVAAWLFLFPNGGGPMEGPWPG